jgi:hypothetical protein
MDSIFDAMVRFFQEDDWHFSQLEGEPILSMGVTGKNGKWSCYAKSREEQKQVIFYSTCSSNAPENKRHDMAEFLTRANYGLVIGNFEMDFNDGEIRYKTSLDVEGDELSSALMKNLVYSNVMMMDRYLPGIMAVLYGGVAPAQAVAQIEG